MRCLAFLIIFNSRLGLKFSTHATNSTIKKIGFRCTKCFRSVVVLVFALAPALNKFRFCSLRKKMINLVGWLSITLVFGCRLTSIKCLIEISLNSSFWNYMTKLSVINCSCETYEYIKCTIRLMIQQLRIVDIVFYVILVVLANLINC